ncbi:MAG: hypothetical protein OXF79_09100 [Chloroflexi bacterium]|nr:hypothetical protein [Chloroflexota bacterium]
MLESLFFVIFHYSLFLLALTLVPALLTAWLCGWKMAGITWQKGLAAGLGGGILGVAVAIAWVCLSFWLQESFADLLGYVLLPTASAAVGAWAICRSWRSRARAYTPSSPSSLARQ